MFTSLTRRLLPLTLISSITLLTACDSGGGNDTPSISGTGLPVVAENTTFVAQYSVTDDSNSITYSLSGADQQLFVIDQSGNVEFITAPDFENGDTGPYELTITATDNEQASASITITINVGDVKDTPSKAVVQTIAPDFSSSQVTYLDVQAQTVTDGFYSKDRSDYTISIYQDNLYHIGRSGIDTISKYNTATPSNEIWMYSTQDDLDSTSRNPYTLVSLNETKAYLIRYASDKVWIVNPQASTSDDFKIGELDLSSYVPTGNTNGTPRPSAGVIADGKLFITMQRLDDGWASSNNVYVAVFDTTTDTEIETNSDDSDSVKGIPLNGLNPLENSIVSFEDTVYVTTRNSYSAANVSDNKSLIEAINVNDYSLNTVLSAADITDNTNKFIKASVIISDEIGYFYANQSTSTPPYSIDTLYQFNPTTGDITISNVANTNTGTTAIGFIGVDTADFLWVSIIEDSMPGVEIIDTRNNEKVGQRLTTFLNPGVIGFIEE